MAPRLILTGFMATGKSHVARLLAERLGWRLFDTDQEIVARAHKPIAKIFADDGEACFRELEREVIARIAETRANCPQCGRPRPAVIATGGGALVDAGNFRALSRTGVIFCLSARPEVIARRLARSKTPRPKLAASGKPIRARIAELMEERSAAYARAAATIDTSDLTAAEVAERVLAIFAAGPRSAR